MNFKEEYFGEKPEPKEISEETKVELRSAINVVQKDYVEFEKLRRVYADELGSNEDKGRIATLDMRMEKIYRFFNRIAANDPLKRLPLTEEEGIGAITFTRRFDIDLIAFIRTLEPEYKRDDLPESNTPGGTE